MSEIWVKEDGCCEADSCVLGCMRVSVRNAIESASEVLRSIEASATAGQQQLSLRGQSQVAFTNTTIPFCDPTTSRH